MCSAMFQLCTITTMCDMSRLIRVFLFGFLVVFVILVIICLLYTSDAADDREV